MDPILQSVTRLLDGSWLLSESQGPNERTMTIPAGTPILEVARILQEFFTPLPPDPPEEPPAEE